MTSLLVVLIDALPFQKVDKGCAPFVQSLRHTSVEPGLGFSCNIYPELFAGLQPDDLGYLNKWSLRAEENLGEPPPWRRLAHRLADLCRVHQMASRAVHLGFEKLSLTGPTDNVPFRFLPYFTWVDEKGIFHGPPYETVFTRKPWRFVLGNEYEEPMGERDAQAIRDGLEAIDSGQNVFVLLPDVDAMGHRTGTGERFEAQIRQADEGARRLAERFREIHGPNSQVVVLSDHGMRETRAEAAVAYDFESKFGPVSADSYLYFLDSVMLRLWTFDDRLSGALTQFLDERPEGKSLTRQERSRFGVMDRRFGDVIFTLREEYFFYPSFFGGRLPTALHGYHPREPSQQAVFSTTESRLPLPARALDVCTFLKRLQH